MSHSFSRSLLLFLVGTRDFVNKVAAYGSDGFISRYKSALTWVKKNKNKKQNDFALRFFGTCAAMPSLATIRFHIIFTVLYRLLILSFQHEYATGAFSPVPQQL
jgi:hypothetical protein